MFLHYHSSILNPNSSTHSFIERYTLFSKHAVQSSCSVRPRGCCFCAIFYTSDILQCQSVSLESTIPGLSREAYAVIRADVLSVLQTALPSSLASQLTANPVAFSSAVVAQFSASGVPSWYENLPAPIQTYLVGQASAAVPSGSISSVLPLNSTVALNSTALSSRTRTVPVTESSAIPSSSEAAPSPAGAASSSSSEGGASLPTAIVGAGLAGAVGLVGLLAL